jgi:nucleolar protein 56
VETVIGFIGVDEEGTVVDVSFYPKDADKIAEAVRKTQSGEVVEEAVKLAESLAGRGFDTLAVESSSIAAAIRERLGVSVVVEEPTRVGEDLRGDIENLAVRFGYINDAEEFRRLIHQVSMTITRARVRRAVERRDLLIAHAVQAVDELDRAVNLHAGRIREWYGTHFPELFKTVDRREAISRLVLNLGNRAGFTKEAIEREGIPSEKAAQLAKDAEESIGSDLREEDLEAVRGMCRLIAEADRLRSDLEQYVDRAMRESSPNIRELTGSMLGAKLIAISGGLASLAKLPASTIQVLGAEKALFRSIRTGARPPKHGIIFQHPSIHQAPSWQRGKIARALAGKIAIAARMDAYTGVERSAKLKSDLSERIAEIRERYKKPHPREPLRRSSRRKRGGGR